MDRSGWSTAKAHKSLVIISLHLSPVSARLVAVVKHS